MKLWKRSVLFYLGGMGYMAMELLYRGWSHGSMFLAGGACFLLLGQMAQIVGRERVFLRAGLGAWIVTAVELLAGLFFNRTFAVWDYRGEFLNFYGQICLPYCFLWVPISLLAMEIYNLLDKRCMFPVKMNKLQIRG